MQADTTTYNKREIKLLENTALGKVKSKNNYVCNLRSCKVMGFHHLDSNSKGEKAAQETEEISFFQECFRMKTGNVQTDTLSSDGR